MGAVQKLATVVIVGLVGLATLLVVYLANEPHRRATDTQTQKEVSIQRGVDMFVQYCVACHAANGAGQLAGDTSVGHPIHIGLPLGGIQSAIDLNQKGINGEGTPWPGGLSARAQYLYNTIYYGKGCDAAGNNCLMPDWGASGQLNEDQINDIVTMIQNVDWNYVFNQAIEANGGRWPTQTGLSSASSASPAAATPAAGSPSSGTATSVTVDLEDIKFVPTSFTIPANTNVKVTLDNKGALPHNFSVTSHDNAKVKDLNVNVTLQPGQSQTITINAPAGDYYYFCDEPGHEAAGMHGVMHVTAGASPAASPAAPGASAPTKATVELEDIKFVPNSFTIAANTDVQVTLANKGALPHDFSVTAHNNPKVKDLNISVTLQPGQSKTITIDAPAGDYYFFCNQPGHEAAGMHGVMHVVAGGSAANGPAPAAQPTQAAGVPTSVTIEGVDIAFQPKAFTIPANTPVQVTFKNTGALPHDFSINQLNIHETLAPGKSVTFTIKAPAGTYQYYCNEPGHKAAGMVGTMTVK